MQLVLVCRWEGSSFRCVHSSSKFLFSPICVEVWIMWHITEPHSSITCHDCWNSVSCVSDELNQAWIHNLEYEHTLALIDSPPCTQMFLLLELVTFWLVQYISWQSVTSYSSCCCNIFQQLWFLLYTVLSAQVAQMSRYVSANLPVQVYIQYNV